VDLENAIRQVIASDEYQASLPRPVEPPAFRLRKPEKGQGRFRKSNESIGIADRIATEVFLLDGRSLAESGRSLTDPGRTFRFEQLHDAMTRNGYALPISMSRLDRPLAACAGYMCQRQHNQGSPA
jgi:hypothetical protein